MAWSASARQSSHVARRAKAAMGSGRPTVVKNSIPRFGMGFHVPGAKGLRSVRNKAVRRAQVLRRDLGRGGGAGGGGKPPKIPKDLSMQQPRPKKWGGRSSSKHSATLRMLGF